MIDFKRAAEDLLARANDLLPQWLPGGKFKGHQYVCGSLNGGPGESLSVNASNGKWAEFAGAEKGNDLISLYAAIHRIKNTEAAVRLGYGDKKELRPKPPPVNQKEKPDFKHSAHGLPSNVWTYHNKAGEPIFHIARYDNGSKKQIIPWQWVGGKYEARAVPEPRPLYNLDRLAAFPDKQILIVEGEKSADAAQNLLGDDYVVTTWPGGSSAVATADWSALKGRKVLIWPDADKPGLSAAARIFCELMTICPEVRVISPEGQPEAWDAADALAEGWDQAKAKEWMAPRITINMPDADIEPATRHLILWNKMGLVLGANKHPIPNLNNVLKVFNGYPSLRDSFHYDEYADKELKADGQEWTDADIVILTARLQDDLGMSRVSKETVYDAVLAGTRLHTFNEPRDWMDSLKWDGISRIKDFFCTAMGAGRTPYVEAVSKNFWISLVARTYQPGCQCDYMPILEGKQGIFKSRALRAIGGSWYASTHEQVNTRDFFVCLRGKMLIEIAELDAFSRSEISRIKDVITTSSDYYRKHYGRRPQEVKRTSVFVGTTNESEYLIDPSGGRRFWPIRCTEIDLGLIIDARERLFAEAVHRFKSGESWHIVPKEDARREQEERYRIDEWEGIISRYLEDFKEIRIADLASGCLKIGPDRLDSLAQKRIISALKRMDWKLKHTRAGNIWQKNQLNAEFNGVVNP